MNQQPLQIPSFSVPAEQVAGILFDASISKGFFLSREKTAIEQAKKTLLLALSEGFSYEAASDLSYKAYFSDWFENGFSPYAKLDGQGLIDALMAAHKPPVGLGFLHHFHRILRLGRWQ